MSRAANPNNLEPIFEWTLDIQKRIEEAGITSTEMKLYPDEVRIPQSTLSAIRNGQLKQLDIKTIEKLCQLLECQPKDLLEGWKIKPDKNLSAKNIKKELKK